MSIQNILTSLGRILAKGKLRILPLIVLLILSCFMTSCVLDREGRLQSYDWLVSDGGRGKWQKVATDGTLPLHIVIGDCCHTKRSNACSMQGTSLQHPGYFDHAVTNYGIGSTDVFIARDGKWQFRYISVNGPNNWQASSYNFLNSSNVSALDIRLVDLDGDCRTDVFATWGGKWRVSEDATGPWEIINTSNIDVANLRFGDFNNDGETDVFSSWGGKWWVSYSGQSAWDDINSSNVQVSELLIADFEGDGRADVFATWGGKWRVSDNGTQPWKIINSSNITVPDLRIGDFNGDGKADIFSSWGGKWHVSWQGKSSWNPINTSNKSVHALKFGDFDGDGTTDVFTIVNTP